MLISFKIELTNTFIRHVHAELKIEEMIIKFFFFFNLLLHQIEYNRHDSNQYYQKSFIREVMNTQRKASRFVNLEKKKKVLLGNLRRQTGRKSIFSLSDKLCKTRIGFESCAGAEPLKIKLPGLTKCGPAHL
jgi:hypothetical protein